MFFRLIFTVTAKAGLGNSLLKQSRMGRRMRIMALVAFAHLERRMSRLSLFSLYLAVADKTGFVDIFFDLNCTGRVNAMTGIAHARGERHMNDLFEHALLGRAVDIMAGKTVRAG